MILLGGGLFDVYKVDGNNKNDTEFLGNLTSSINKILTQKTADTMPVQKYDIPHHDEDGTGSHERYWSTLNIPVMNTEGEIEYIIHKLEDVTEFTHLKRKSLEQDELTHKLITKAEEMNNEIFKWAHLLEEEKEKWATKNNISEKLLLNILPADVAAELKLKGTSEAKFFDQVTIMFTDFVNFSKASERMSPGELVNELHECFKVFDRITSHYKIEKIKTIGDAYLAVAGLPALDPKHAENTILASMEISKFMKNRHAMLKNKTFEVRIGVHSGSVVAGIVGIKKFVYDIWGDSVNIAARLQQKSKAGKINISETTYELVKNKFPCEYRGEISAKHKGKLKMYFIND